VNSVVLIEGVAQVVRDAKFNFSIGKATAHSQLSWVLKVTVAGNLLHFLLQTRYRQVAR
jgi:hypothetical protein